MYNQRVGRDMQIGVWSLILGCVLVLLNILIGSDRRKRVQQLFNRIPLQVQTLGSYTLRRSGEGAGRGRERGVWSLTLGCVLVSLSICIGSGSEQPYPMMVGPNTLAKLATGILHSGLSDTLGDKS